MHRAVRPRNSTPGCTLILCSLNCNYVCGAAACSQWTAWEREGCRSLPSFPSFFPFCFEESNWFQMHSLTAAAPPPKNRNMKENGGEKFLQNSIEKNVRNFYTEEAGEEAVDHFSTWCYSSHRRPGPRSSKTFITVTSRLETMCGPNEDLRAVLLSCSWQMCQKKRKKCTKWYLARANPHPAPMWTQHQRPSQQHVRPIYKPMPTEAPSLRERAQWGEAGTHAGQNNSRAW